MSKILSIFSMAEKKFANSPLPIYMSLVKNEILTKYQSPNMCITDARNTGRILTGSFYKNPTTLSKGKPETLGQFEEIIKRNKIVQLTAKGITKPGSMYCSKTSQHAINIVDNYEEDGELKLVIIDRDNTFSAQPLTDQFSIISSKDLYNMAHAHKLKLTEDFGFSSAPDKTVEEDFLTGYLRWKPSLHKDY